MFNFKEYFKDEYQYALKDVTYRMIENDIGPENIQLKFLDSVSTNIEKRRLVINFCRKVGFNPETIFALSVEFCIIVTFKDEIDLDNINIDWSSELTNNENPYLGNVICRASNIISAITSSCGQQPIITPPSIVKEA